MIFRLLATVAWCATVAVTPAAAHTVGVSRGEYRADGDVVHGALTFARGELLAAVPELDTDRNGILTDAEIVAGRAALATAVAAGVSVGTAAGACDGRLDDVVPLEQDGVALETSQRCAHAVTGFRVRLPLLDVLSLGHRHVALLTAGDAVVRGALHAAEPELAVGDVEPIPSDPSVHPTDAAPAPAASSAFRLGVARVLSNRDHLFLLAALLLAAVPWRATAGALAAFTLAHSVALATAALGAWSPAPAPIGVASALAITWLGLGNYARVDPPRRWRLAYVVGLAQGGGLATALPAVVRPATLASFHVGVEAGQLLLLTALSPLVAVARRDPLRLASLALAVIGAWRIVERITAS